MQKHFWSLFIFCCLLTTIPAGARAESEYALQVTEKLGRGIANIVFSPLEITKDIESKLEQGYLSRILFVSPLQGTAKMVRRIVVGAHEMATFLVPSDPILEPAYSTPSIAEYLEEDKDPRIDRHGKDEQTIYLKESTEVYENKQR